MSSFEKRKELQHCCVTALCVWVLPPRSAARQAAQIHLHAYGKRLELVDFLFIRE